MQPEHVVLLDDNGNEIGIAEKLATHHANTPLHKAFSCYVFNTKGQLLVTQRAASKKVWPGVWTNSCCGHPAQGETDQEAIARRIEYELGMRIENEPTCIVPYYRYKTPPYNGIIEHESCPIYVTLTTQEPNPNPAEVDDYAWMDWDEYQNQLRSDTGDVYSWWCKDQLRFVQAPIADLLPTICRQQASPKSLAT